MNNCSASDYGIRQNGYKGLSKKKKKILELYPLDPPICFFF